MAGTTSPASSREQSIERISADGDAYDRTLDRHIAA